MTCWRRRILNCKIDEISRFSLFLYLVFNISHHSYSIAYNSVRTLPTNELLSKNNKIFRLCQHICSLPSSSTPLTLSLSSTKSKLFYSNLPTNSIHIWIVIISTDTSQVLPFISKNSFNWIFFSITYTVASAFLSSQKRSWMLQIL